MNELKVFENTEFGELGVLVIESKEYFPATDCARILGYSNPRDAIHRHCKAEGVVQHDGVSKTIDQYGDSSEQATEKAYITQGNPYCLIVRSKLPTAEKFERWIFDEVLPSIRRHGAYATEVLLNNPDLFINVLKKLKEEKETRLLLESENLKQKQIIGELKPKSDYTDMILKSKSLVSINQIAKDYGMSGQQMNKLLHKFGVQYKQNDQWLLYSKYQSRGYTHSETIQIHYTNGFAKIRVFTKWTQKGRLFIYQLLKVKTFYRQSN